MSGVQELVRLWAGGVLFAGTILSILMGGQVLAWALGYEP